MENMRYITQTLSICLIIVLSTLEVKACSVCIWTATDKVIPPIYTWCLISIGWFLLYSLIFSWYKVKVFGILSILETVILLVTAIFLTGVLGPIPLLPFGITPAIIFLRSFPQTNKGKWTDGLYYSVQIVGVIATISILVTAYQCYQIRQTRTPVQYMIQWQGMAGYSTVLEQLKQQEPASLNDYRYILEYGRGFVLTNVAQRVAIIGDPENDSKLIKKTIERIRNTPNSLSVVESLEKSLQDLQSRNDKK